MKKGFTLIEMLISMVIFSFIIALATYSFRFYSDMVKKIIMPYPEKAVNFSYLNDIIDSIFYFVEERKDPVLNKKSFFIYFYGNSNGMTFVSSNPVYIENNIAVCKLYVNDNKSLILEESPIYYSYNNYKIPTLISRNKKVVVLFKNVSDFKLTYFIDGKRKVKLRERIPSFIEMRMTSNNKKIVFYFKVQSNFNDKIGLTRSFYAPL